MRIKMKSNLLIIIAGSIFLTNCNSADLNPSQDKQKVIDSNFIESYDCFPQEGGSTLEIATWNIERYPLNANTPEIVKAILDTMKVDVIALQEIQNPDNLIESVIDSLPDWEFVYGDVRYDLEIGYAYRLSEIVHVEPLELLFPHESNAFPREPVFTAIEHISGLKVNLINIHLKCCNDGEERRAIASEMLKKYIDSTLADEKVIVLGDFNDEIGDAENPFANFINDPENYQFVDMEIALGDPEFWSYPSYGPEGSHIDHILISNELFDFKTSIKTLKIDNCISSYENNLSDHLPLMIILTNH
jgi:endonuclease/exonuclease/phosphatase family metal-dependent hydrolase